MGISASYHFILRNQQRKFSSSLADIYYTFKAPNPAPDKLQQARINQPFRLETVFTRGLKRTTTREDDTILIYITMSPFLFLFLLMPSTRNLNFLPFCCLASTLRQATSWTREGNCIEVTRKMARITDGYFDRRIEPKIRTNEIMCRNCNRMKAIQRDCM